MKVSLAVVEAPAPITATSPFCSVADSTLYAKEFGGHAWTRNNAPVVELPGVQLRFAKVDKAQLPTAGHTLDHIGFDVKNLEAFVKKLQADGVKVDRPYTKNAQTGAALAFIYDPWGTYIELNERPNPL